MTDAGARSTEGGEAEPARLYEDLKRLAGHHLARERANHTLQATALVHEVFMRMARQRGQPGDRGRFLSVASEMIRRILVDYARSRGAAKRGGKKERVPLDGVVIESLDSEPVDVLALDGALKELAELSGRQARVVELRFFADLSVEETAEVLGVSAGTVKGDWRVARAWLKSRLSGS